MADDIANILLRISGDADDADDTLETFAGKLAAFGKTSATAEANVNTAGATKLAALESALQKFGRTRAIAKAEVETGRTDNITRVLTQLEQFAKARQIEIPIEIQREGMDRALAGLQGIISQRNLVLEPKVNTAAALADLAALNATMAAVLRDRHVEVDVDRGGKLGLVMQTLTKAGSLFSQAGEGAASLGKKIGGITVNLGPFGVKLTAVTGAVLGLVVAMAVSLVAAAALMVTALVGAAAAVAALATAFAAALGPAVALAIAAFTRISKILEALKSAQTAKDEAERKSAEGTKAAQAAEEKRRSALIALGAAIRAQASSERGLNQAQDEARAGIVQANEDAARSQEDLGRANEEVADQMTAGFEAIKQSAEDVRDALLAVEDARLGIKESGLAVKQAKLNLKEFRQEAGLAGKQFNDIFKKATDVSGGGVDVKKLLPSLSVGADGQSTADQALEAEKLVLAVQRAKLGEKQSTDKLGDSIRDLNTRRKEAAAFQREGLAAFEPYTNAVRAQEDATQRLAEATERANTLNQQGVAKNPAVLAAQESLTSSNERLVQARREAAQAAEPAAGSDAAAKATQQWDKLSKAEQSFGLALQATITNLKSFFGPAVEAVLGGLASAFANSGALLNPLKESFTNFGKIVGGVFANLGKSLGDPAVVAGLKQLIEGAGQLAAVMGNKVFPAFFGIILNIANAAMPYLIRGMERFGRLLQGLSSNSGGEKLKGFFGTIMGLLKGIGGFTVALGRVFAAFFTSTTGSAKGFLTTITDMTNKFAAFLQSPAGQDMIKQFFEDVIPLALQTFKFIGNVIAFILQVVQILAPALTGFLSILNTIITIVNGVLFVLRPFLQIAAQIALLFIGGIPRAIGAVISRFGVLVRIVKLLSSGFTHVVTVVIGKLSALASFFPTAFGWIQTAVTDIVRFIRTWFNKIIGYIRYPFEKALEFLGGLGEKFFEVGKAIVTGLVDGLKSVVGLPFKMMRKAWELVADDAPGSEPKNPNSPMRGLKKSGKAILENLASGIQANSGLLAASIEQHINPVIGAIDAPPARSARSAGGGGVGRQYNGAYIENQAIQMPEGAAGTDGETQAALLMMGLRRRGRG